MSERDELLTNTDDDDIDESSPCNYGEEPVSSAAPSSPYCADQQQSQQNNIMVGFILLFYNLRDLHVPSGPTRS
jgi:hypothetical protein